MITRDEFVENLKAQVDELNTGIKKIERKAESTKEKIKDKLDARVKYLRKKSDSAHAKIQEVKNASEDAWHDLKQGAENVVDSLKDSLMKTIAHFKKKKSDIISGKIPE